MNPKVLAILVMVFLYSLSPIDFIPDFIPGLGNLDDAVLSALGIWMASRKPKDGGTPPPSA